MRPYMKTPPELMKATCSPHILASLGVTRSVVAVRTMRYSPETEQAHKEALAKLPASLPTLNKAKANANPLPADELSTILNSLPPHVHALTNGTGNTFDWSQMIAMLSMMMAIEKESWVSIGKHYILNGWRACSEMQQRHFIKKAQLWSLPIQATEQEAEWLNAAFAAYAVQLRMLNRGDLSKHLATARGWNDSALNAIILQWQREVKEMQNKAA